MHRALLTCLLTLVTLPTLGQASPTSSPQHIFTTEADHFTLDGKPFKVISGELHYARIPREYWHARLKMAKAMGLNTIATYVFWNVHEPTPGHYDFSGNNDLAAFIKAAQQEGLYVILRSGPYGCAEWDFGGLPPWLLADPANGKLIRSNDPAFMVPAERWIKRLAQEATLLQIGRGGPILMTQIENEYGNFAGDHAYMAHLKQIYQQVGFTDSLLFSADNWRNIPNGSLPGLYAATNFGIGNHQGGMDALEKVRPDQPLFVSEYWPGWFDHWGHPHETRPVAPQLEDVSYILKRGAGINIYMFHGGTSFGFMAGATGGAHFLPDVTSYDYDAPLDEGGRPTPKYFAYRKLLATYSPCGNESCLPPVPTAAPIITLPTISLTEYSALWQSQGPSNLPKPILADQPANMERFGQNYGYILYRTSLPANAQGDLILDKLRDYAQIYLNSHLTGTLDRREADPHGNLPAVPIGTAIASQLDLLVANDGRINSSGAMRDDAKGITHSVTLNGQPLTNWQVYPLPMTTLPTHYSKIPSPSTNKPQPGFLRARFKVANPGDAFLDTTHVGKGALWINGHAIGRFWTGGPQNTLYIPGPWLHKGTNEIVVFDMTPTPKPTVTGLDHPILDGPTPNQSKSKQE
jgi:beta-galactosidase